MPHPNRVQSIVCKSSSLDLLTIGPDTCRENAVLDLGRGELNEVKGDMLGTLHASKVSRGRSLITSKLRFSPSLNV